MWLKNPAADLSPRTITLTEILTKMNGSKPVAATGELKKYLDTEALQAVEIAKREPIKAPAVAIEGPEAKPEQIGPFYHTDKLIKVYRSFFSPKTS